MSSLTVPQDQKWLPTHVQVTVLRGRGLRGKGKHGTSDVYTIIQLGKEKYSTCVAEKTTEPEWREECSFELQPGVLESGFPSGSNELVLTVMHRALIGMDVFLGQAVIQLDKVFMESRSVKNEWYRLNSKTGKKEKERGDIQASIQFTRNNLTASMYDLVMKDKSASTFSKLKEHMRGRRRSSEKDSSSAVLPSGYGSMYRMRQRLPSEGGGEEDYEDDEGGEVRRSKMRTFFLRGKLRKSSDTRSSTSLGSESSESSSRGGSLSPTAGISVVVSDLSNSASNSSNLTADNSPEHTANTSPKLSPLKSDFGDEVREITIVVPQPAVSVNGSYAYDVQTLDLGPGNPVGTLGLGPTQKTLSLSHSLQNLSPWACKETPGQVGDGRRWSFDKPCEEEKAAIAAALEKSGPMFMEEEPSGRGALTEAMPSFCAWTAESESTGKKQKRKGPSPSKTESEQASAATEERHRSWFGLKESHSKPSLVVSPTLEFSTDPHPLSFTPNPHLPAPPVDPASLDPPLHHTNPFCRSQPPRSPCNPFFTFQHNPFYKQMPTSQHLNRSLPPLPYLSSARPPITQLFPELSNEILASTHNNPASEDSTNREDMEILGQSPFFVKAEKTPLIKKPANPFMPVQELEVDSQWDDSFEAFAAGRLQSPEDFTADCGKQQNLFRDSPLHPSSCEGVLPSTDEDDLNTNNAQRYQTYPLASSTLRLDSFPAILDTIPENMSDNSAVNSSSNFKDLNACTTNHSIHTEDSSHITSAPLGGSSSPDPSSSGLGSSAEDDYLSCLSTHSDKVSASSEEAESSILCFEKLKKPSISAEDFSDTSNNLSLVDAVQQTVIQYEDNDEEKVYLNSAEASLASPVQKIEAIDSKMPNNSYIVSPCTSLEPNCTNSASPEEYSKEFNSSAHFSADIMNSYTLPSFSITTSSPNINQQGLNASIKHTSAGQSDDSQKSPTPFVDFRDYHNSYSPKGPESTLLHTHVSYQTLNVSADSQDYQSCESQPSSKYSSVIESLHSANSTLSGENKANPSAGLKVFNTTRSFDEEVNQSHRFNGFLNGTQDVTVTCEQSLTVGAVSDPHISCTPKHLSDGEVEHLYTLTNTLLQRSNSEGTLARAFNSLPVPSFGSDPGAIQDSSLVHAGPALPSLTSFPPSLTPESSRFPEQLCTLPSLAKASATAMQAISSIPMSQETGQKQAANQLTSPHPVKPLTSAMLTEEKRSVLATGLEKLKSTINPGRSSHSSEQEVDRKKFLTEGAGSYYHLTHSELVSLLVQREAELGRQKAEFERQKLLLSKREVELKRLKPQVRDLEDYIDTLLVRIMEQKPTLLQVGSRLK